MKKMLKLQLVTTLLESSQINSQPKMRFPFRSMVFNSILVSKQKVSIKSKGKCKLGLQNLLGKVSF